MSNIIKIKFLKRKIPSSLLGLGLDGSRLEGVVLRRSNGSLQVSQRFSATLSLDPLTNDAELVSREILNQLEAAGIRERNCVVALPLKWALAAHTKVPKLPESDVASFLYIEAERGFPTDVATLQVVTSRLVSSTGEEHATFVGIPRSHVERLEQILRGAKLKLLSFSLGITALQPAKDNAAGVLALVIGENQVGLQVTCGGGVAALRALEGVLETESGQRVLHGDLIAREARITLGQLPADVRDSVKQIRVFGPRDQAQRLADEIRPRFETGGLRIEAVATYPPNEFVRTLPPETTVSGALSLAARQLAGRSDPFEFLPPKVSAWQTMTSKYAPDKLRKVGAAAAAALLVILAMFGYQEWRLMSLRSQWSRMSVKVHELDTISQQITQYRPWFDDSFRCLNILKVLTATFPEDGSVTAKTVEIRDMNTVSCAGNAANYTVLNNTVKQLGATNGPAKDLGVKDLNVQTRGKSPMQFTLDFHLRGGPGEN
jgi:hypothetical protein